MNGDGFDDAAVGAPLWKDDDDQSAGAVMVFHGSARGLARTPNWTAAYPLGVAWFGFAVASAGDVNGDGFDDLIVGAPLADHADVLDVGETVLFLGAATGLEAEPSWRIVGTQAFSDTGTSVAGIGDVDGDGFDDVLVGAPEFRVDGVAVGGVQVFRGSSTGLEETASYTKHGTIPLGRFGAEAAPAGDVNGDGWDDVVIGSHHVDIDGDLGWEGAAALYLGSADGVETQPLWTRIGDPDLVDPEEGGALGGEFGAAVSGGGDLDGDGYDDVVIGAPRFIELDSSEGAVYAFLGSPTGPSDDPDWRLQSDEEHAQFGHSLASGGDLTGDGFADRPPDWKRPHRIPNMARYRLADLELTPPLRAT